MVRVRRATPVLVGVPALALALSMVPVTAANTVTSSDIVDNTIQAVDIAPNAVGASETGPNSVGFSEIVTNGVGALETAPNSVGLSEIVHNGVGADETAPNSVGLSEIVTNGVGANELRPDSVGESEIATDAVGSDEIADGEVDTFDLSPFIQVETADLYGAADSFQLIAADLVLAAGAGTSDAGDSAFLGAEMGNIHGSNLTKTHNYVGGVIGHYSVTGTNASTYPVGAVLGGISDNTNTADGAFVAYIDGDSSPTTAGAAFKVMNNNSTASSGFDFGVDLQDAAHDGYQPVDENFYNKAPLRVVKDVVVLVDDAAPVDGTTGDNVAGPGSLYVDTSGAKLYINTGSITAPTWTVVGSQS